MSKLPLELKKYFFPVQTVKANPAHKVVPDDNGLVDESVNNVQVKSNISKVVDRDDLYSVELTVKLDEEASKNPAYFFEITAFGIFEISRKASSEENKRQIATSGTEFLVGVTRERLASITSRGPWNQIILHSINFDDFPSPSPE